MVTPTRQAVIERRIQGAGLELFLTERGDPTNPTVVCIHGFPDTSAVWEPIAAALEGQFHVVTYDVRGAGRSDVPTERGQYALPLLAADVEAVIDATSPDRPVHLLAHDWGSIQGWEAVSTERLAGRIASYTSISGPPIDHAALWFRRHRTRRIGDVVTALRQAMHSWYIVYFHLPGLPKLMTRNARVQRVWGQALHRMEKAPVDASWPAASFSTDFANGVELYRANIRPRMLHPTLRQASCPVQLIIPLKDRYVTPALLEGLEERAPLMWRRTIDAGHWVVRSQADEIANDVRELVAFIEDGTESDDLRQARVA
jgi:pimeloyl-ACP methyl ester carboxylesterase